MAKRSRTIEQEPPFAKRTPDGSLRPVQGVPGDPPPAAPQSDTPAQPTAPTPPPKEVPKEATASGVWGDQETTNAIQKERGLDLKAIERPLDKFNAEMDHIIADLKSGAISPAEAKRLAAVDQGALNKQIAAPDYRATSQSARRFDFGDLAPPEIAQPMNDLVQIQTDSLAEQKTQTQLFTQVNQKIQTLETWTPAPQP